MKNKTSKHLAVTLIFALGVAGHLIQPAPLPDWTIIVLASALCILIILLD